MVRNLPYSISAVLFSTLDNHNFTIRRRIRTDVMLHACPILEDAA